MADPPKRPIPLLRDGAFTLRTNRHVRLGASVCLSAPIVGLAIAPASTARTAFAFLNRADCRPATMRRPSRRVGRTVTPNAVIVHSAPAKSLNRFQAILHRARPPSPPPHHITGIAKLAIRGGCLDENSTCLAGDRPDYSHPSSPPLTYPAARDCSAATTRLACSNVSRPTSHGCNP